MADSGQKLGSRLNEWRPDPDIFAGRRKLPTGTNRALADRAALAASLVVARASTAAATAVPERSNQRCNLGRARRRPDSLGLPGSGVLSSVAPGHPAISSRRRRRSGVVSLTWPHAAKHLITKPDQVPARAARCRPGAFGAQIAWFEAGRVHADQAVRWGRRAGVWPNVAITRKPALTSPWRGVTFHTSDVLPGLGACRSRLGPAVRCFAAGTAPAKAGLVPVGRSDRTLEPPVRTRPRRTSIALALATLGRRVGPDEGAGNPVGHATLAQRRSRPMHSCRSS